MNWYEPSTQTETKKSLLFQNEIPIEMVKS